MTLSVVEITEEMCVWKHCYNIYRTKTDIVEEKVAPVLLQLQQIPGGPTGNDNWASTKNKWQITASAITWSRREK